MGRDWEVDEGRGETDEGAAEEGREGDATTGEAERRGEDGAEEETEGASTVTP